MDLGGNVFGKRVAHLYNYVYYCIVLYAPKRYYIELEAIQTSLDTYFSYILEFCIGNCDLDNEFDIQRSEICGLLNLFPLYAVVYGNSFKMQGPSLRPQPVP